jgi:predicted ATPase/DNA-binding NarL/FixJ family response regulator
MIEEIALSAHLPPQPTSFVGRETERQALARLLSDPQCRLVTLIGPGGIGKTRLALAVAERLRGAFARGVAFAALQAVPDAGHLPQAIGEAVGCPASAQGEPAAHLLDFLGRRELLLVLDNFEHLLDGTPLLSDLLAAAPGVRLLVTSRAALNLQEEWRFPLEGLAFPADDAGATCDPCDAMRLFDERASRARLGFALAEERAAVARICRLVEGLPLAIELAAAWTKSLSCDAIADEIARNLAFLETSLRNLPPRHRSMRAAFDSSWQLLTPEERAVFRRFAVFRGGFQREAAAQVAGASLPVLASLLDKSLLRYEPDGRYHLHELLRQYAEEHLLAIPDEAAGAVARHGAFYLGFLADRVVETCGGDQLGATTAVLAELENIRAALPGAIDGADLDVARRATEALTSALEFRGMYGEGLDLLRGVVPRVRAASPGPGRDRALAAVLVAQGWMAMRVGQLAEARAAMEESRDHLARLGMPPQAGLATDPDLGLAVLALTAGDYPEATRLGETVIRRCERHGLRSNLPYAWYAIANAALAEGRYEAAQHAAQQARIAAERAGDRWFLAYCLNDLGKAAQALGDYDEARHYMEAAYALREEFGDPEGMAVALAQLGRVAMLQGELAVARRHLERARALYDDLGDRGGLASTLHRLGDLAALEGDLPAALQALARALQVADEIGFRPLALAIIASSADLAIRLRRVEEAAIMAALVRDHPAAERAVRERAQRALARAEGQLAPASFDQAVRRGAEIDLDPVVRRLLAELALPAELPPGDAPPVGRATPAAQPDGALPEPLTPREREILRLVASGHSNQAIADALFLSLNTVKWHSSRIFGKLGVESRAQAIVRARELRLIE